MKKQRTKGIVLVVVCFICVMCICSGFHKAQSEELSEIPDAVNSTRFNTTEHLTVVANQEEIADPIPPAPRGHVNLSGKCPGSACFPAQTAENRKECAKHEKDCMGFKICFQNN